MCWKNEQTRKYQDANAPNHQDQFDSEIIEELPDSLQGSHLNGVHGEGERRVVVFGKEQNSLENEGWSLQGKTYREENHINREAEAVRLDGVPEKELPVGLSGSNEGENDLL